MTRFDKPAASSIEFEIPFTAIAKQADRSRIVKTGSGRQFVAHYQPKEIVEHADNLAALLAPHRPTAPLRGPLELTLTFKFPWLGTAPSRVIAAGWYPKDTKPDWDNLSKQICDVLQKCGFFINDSQIWNSHVRKVFCPQASVQIQLLRTVVIWTPTGEHVVK